MDLFGRMANPSQDKIALEFPELRIQAVKQQLLQLLTDSFFNDFTFSPLHQPDVSAWYPGSNYDVSRPFERRTWIWIAQKLQFIKTGMTTLLSNFSASGNLANDADDHTRDLKFFQVYGLAHPFFSINPKPFSGLLPSAASMVLGLHVLGPWPQCAVLEHFTSARRSAPRCWN